MVFKDTSQGAELGQPAQISRDLGPEKSDAKVNNEFTNLGNQA